MYLYYDRVSKQYTLDAGDDGVVFLGPITNAVVLLRSSYGLTESQAQEAALQAFMNMGAAVDLRIIKKIAGDYCTYFRRNLAEAT